MAQQSQYQPSYKAVDRIPFRVRPMLATLVPEPFHRSGWVYEEKYDGDRILAYKEGARVHLFSRNAKDHTAAFPEIAAEIGALPHRTLILDGAVIALDKLRQPAFLGLRDDKSAREVLLPGDSPEKFNGK